MSSIEKECLLFNQHPIFCQGIHTYPIIMTHNTTRKRHTFKKQLPSESHTTTKIAKLYKISPKTISYSFHSEIVIAFFYTIHIHNVGIVYHKNIRLQPFHHSLHLP